MNYNLELLSLTRSVSKLYSELFSTVCKAIELNHVEADIIAFLANNPSFYTARDIVEYRLIPKANVSQAVESLIKKNLLTRHPDTEDHRRIHLELTPNGLLLIPEIKAAQEKFLSIIFKNFTQDELAAYTELNRRLCNNAADYTKKEY